MVQDTIRAVREAEKEADQMKKDASEKGKVLIEEAKKEAEAMREQTLQKVKEKRLEAEQALAKEGEAYLTNSVSEAGKEINSLRENTKGKSNKVMEVIMENLI